jgi:hypothetical protein
VRANLCVPPPRELRRRAERARVTGAQRGVAPAPAVYSILQETAERIRCVSAEVFQTLYPKGPFVRSFTRIASKPRDPETCPATREAATARTSDLRALTGEITSMEVPDA